MWLGLAAGVAWGQINYFPEELATNDDGSRLLFASSLRLRGSEQHFFRKIFLFEGGSFRLLAQREPPESLLALGRPEMTGDGTIAGYVAENLRSQDTCGMEREEAVVAGVPGRPEMRWPGRVKLGRNGRFALVYRPCRSMNLVDLVTGEQTSLIADSEQTALTADNDFTGVSGTGRRVVTSDGAAVFVRTGASRLTIGRRTGLVTLATSQPAYNAVIDDLATTIVYETPNVYLSFEGRPARVMLFDLASGTERELARGVGDALEPALSNDGRLVLFLSWAGPRLPQVFVINRDGSGLRQLSSEPDGIAKAVLSGDGRVIFALTNGGLLRRIEVSSGKVQDLAGRVPRVGGVYPGLVPPPGVVPGSLARLSGLGLADQAVRATPPLPTTLGGVRIGVAGIPALLLSVSPTDIWVQIPWEAPVGETVTLETGAVSPFEGRPDHPIRTVDKLVRFYSEAIHSDFRGFLTYDDAARPGEIIHLYMTGLGPVAPPVSSGAASPSNPPAVAVRPPTCRFRQYFYPPAPLLPGVQEWPAEIVFAGLAPGLVGIYQVSLRAPLGPFLIPYPPALPDMWLWCQYDLPPATLPIPIRNLISPSRARR